MPRRTPLEVYINGQTDRQAQYEKRRRDAGFTKACAWVPAVRADEFKELARRWCAEKEAEDAEKAAPEGSPAPAR